jgi:hypothetical protein
VTEAAALAAGRWTGRGDKNSADQAAVDAMRLMIDTVEMQLWVLPLLTCGWSPNTLPCALVSEF